MAADTERTVESAVRDLVRSERVNGNWYVHLPMLYPDGSFVTVRIDQAPGGLRISDAGFAYREADRVEASRSFKRIANSVAQLTDVSVAERSVFVVAHAEELERAIFDVAEASWRIADRICRRVWDEDSDELPLPLKARLEELFGADRLEEGAQVKGDSTTDWQVSAVVRFPDHTAVFQLVRDHPISINKAATAFSDLARLKKPPRLVAVVESKEALGSRLALLAPARVLETGQPDDLFRKAAA